MADDAGEGTPISLEDVLHHGQLPVEPGGTDLGDGVRLSPGHSHVENAQVTAFEHKIYRDDVHIGSVDYDACHACRCVMLGEIGLVDNEQRRGIGTRVLAQLRTELPSYRWFITPEKTSSRPFWARIRATYPGEYLLGAREHLGCWHLLF
ncbi:hypothetical protein [Amycolatopsis eburnea]|uniref:N-acetyltransferase n=1 Tax=Amycolatopsis eburnea TaxID=2267691 RepID=A0A3R9E599_9PSEU|nr:hypothetical protein [Amycolatopsis eburnea]RSD26420.1 hypothetical protein EIY87_00070 [Amycolatopsis eburnea]